MKAGKLLDNQVLHSPFSAPLSQECSTKFLLSPWQSWPMFDSSFFSYIVVC